MLTLAIFSRNRWTIQDLEDSGLQMEHPSHKIIKCLSSHRASIIILTDHRAHNQIIISWTTRAEELDQRLSKHLRIMGACSLYSKRTAWRTPHRSHSEKTCYPRSTRIIGEILGLREELHLQPQLWTTIIRMRIGQGTVVTRIQITLVVDHTNHPPLQERIATR